jgi:hypothetical protein
MTPKGSVKKKKKGHLENDLTLVFQKTTVFILDTKRHWSKYDNEDVLSKQKKRAS